MLEATKKRASFVREMVTRHYEPGWQARGLRWVWIRWVNPVIPMSFSTFKHLLYATGWTRKEHIERQQQQQQQP